MTAPEAAASPAAHHAAAAAGGSDPLVTLYEHLCQRILVRAAQSDSGVVHTAPLVSKQWCAALQLPAELGIRLPAGSAAAEHAAAALAAYLNRSNQRARAIQALAISQAKRSGSHVDARSAGAALQTLLTALLRAADPPCTLQRLTLAPGVWDGSAAALQHLGRFSSTLVSLNVYGMRLGADAAQAVAQQLPQLTYLEGGGNKWGVRGMAWLRQLQNLRYLGLRKCHLDLGCVRALAAAHGRADSSTSGGAGVGGAGGGGGMGAVEGVGSAEGFGGSANGVGGSGVGSASGLTQLTHLDLGHNSLPYVWQGPDVPHQPDAWGFHEVLRALGGRFTALQTLDVSAGGAVAPHSIRALGQSMPHLTDLALIDTQLGADCAAELARMIRLRRLVSCTLNLIS